MKLNILINGLKNKQPIFTFINEKDEMIIYNITISHIDNDSIVFTIEDPINLENFIEKES